MGHLLAASPTTTTTDNGGLFNGVNSFFNSGTWLVIRNMAIFFVAVFWLASVYWVYKDARRRIADPWLVSFATILGFVVPFIGPLVYLFFRPPEYDQAAFNKRVKKEGVPALLREFTEELRTLEPFDRATIEQRLHAFCEQQGIKLADMNHALRVASTGVPVGPGLFDCLAILGREEVLKRVEAALLKT